MAIRHVRIQWLDENRHVIVSSNTRISAPTAENGYQREFRTRVSRRWDGKIVRGHGAAWLLQILDEFLLATCDPDPSVGVAPIHSTEED